MKTVKFRESIEINCSDSDVFNYTQDYENRLKWDLFLKRAELMNGATSAAKGVKAYCVAKNGIGMITEYITFNRPKATAIKMIKGPFMFKSFFGSWSFKTVRQQTTMVIFVYSYSLRFPFNLFGFIIKTNLKNNVKQRLVDLKQNMENVY